MPKRIVLSDPLDLGDVWLPCEYVHSKQFGVQILSLGDVDSEATSGGKHFVNKPLPDAARDFLTSITGNRKLAVLIPSEHLDKNEWPYKQMLRKELIARLMAECEDDGV